MLTALNDKVFDLVIEYIQLVKLSKSTLDADQLESYNGTRNLEAQLIAAGLTYEQILKIDKAVR